MSDVPEAPWLAFKSAFAELEDVLRTAGSTLPERRQECLLAALNRLELACLDLPCVESRNARSGDSPNTYEERRAEVAAAFPEFGFYNTTDMRSSDPAGAVNLGDAVNDLADILRDLDDAVWHEAKTDLNDAVWEARFAYEHHFGAHLADLRAYLYRLRFFGY